MDNVNARLRELDEIERTVADARNKLEKIERERKVEEKQQRQVVSALDVKIGDKIDSDALLKFFKKPYVIIPQGRHKILVAVPKFIKNFAVGWLWKETESYYIYSFDQYSAWLGDAPAELLSEIDFKHGFNATVEGNVISYERDQRAEVVKALRPYLSEGKIGDTQATIKKGCEFDVIVEMVKSGCLPFKAQPVDKADLREPSGKIVLKPHQLPAKAEFLRTGAIGAFHPTGAGKSFITMHLFDIVKGRKALFVPTITLKEQWHEYISQNIPERRHEIDIFTYSSNRRLWEDTQYALTAFDECQYLPADTFSRLAFLKTKYRIGLSASPHREDGRESYVIALTGFPIGLNWQEYMKETGRSYHPIHVHVVRSGKEAKLRKLRELLNPKKRTMIFCDSIDLGKEIGRTFDVPYIHGETSDRLTVIKENNVVAMSRVGDVGVSVKDLEQIIEVDFLYGSRQQQLQRTGRLMHSEEAERHDIIMTEQEIRDYGKRIWALQEKGFTIKIHE